MRSLRRFGIAVFACAVLLPVAACHRAVPPDSGLTVQSGISPQPVRVGPATILLRLADSSAKPVSGAKIVLEGNMSHAGMAPVFGGSREVEPGRYSGDLTFSMPGDWVVLLHVTLADGTTVERQLEVRGVQSN